MFKDWLELALHVFSTLRLSFGITTHTQVRLWVHRWLHPTINGTISWWRLRPLTPAGTYPSFKTFRLLSSIKWDCTPLTVRFSINRWRPLTVPWLNANPMQRIELPILRQCVFVMLDSAQSSFSTCLRTCRYSQFCPSQLEALLLQGLVVLLRRNEMKLKYAIVIILDRKGLFA